MVSIIDRLIELKFSFEENNIPFNKFYLTQDQIDQVKYEFEGSMSVVTDDSLCRGIMIAGIPVEIVK